VAARLGRLLIDHGELDEAPGGPGGAGCGQRGLEVKAHRPIQPFRSLAASSVRFCRSVDTIRQWRIIEAVELIETSIFTKQITALLSDED
jgi:hypothetical protein